ncbi:4275_t:CDS:2, partial [Diversispora eburnea]
MTENSEEKHSWFGQIKEAIEHEAKSFNSLKAEGNVMKAFDDLDDRVIEKLKDTTLYPELEWDATVRNNNDLSEEEIKFIHDRKLFIREAFAKYVGVDVSEIHIDDIPVIAFMGSGGGFRSMISFTAYLRAVQESELYDCGVYLTGLSETSDPQTAVELVFGSLIQKNATGVKLSIMDVYGALLAAKLMIGKDPTKQFGDFKLSEQRKYIDGGKNLMPLYVSTFHVRPWKEDALKSEEAALFPNYEETFENHKMKKDYYRWYEFNPYEIGNEENPAWIPSWAFGRKFEFGKTVERFPEPSFGILLGAMGAAPSVSLIEVIKGLEIFLPDGNFRDELKNLYDEAMEKIGTHNQQ